MLLYSLSGFWYTKYLLSDPVRVPRGVPERVGSSRVRPWHAPEPARVGKERSEPDPTRLVRKLKSI